MNHICLFNNYKTVVLLNLAQIDLIFRWNGTNILTMKVSLRHEEVNDLDYSHSNGHIFPRFAFSTSKVF